jgi:hypothetical protein
LRGRPAVLSGAGDRAGAHFREECLKAFGFELLLFPEEVEEFRRDLELYAQLSARQSATALQEGPFVDRAAFLLDPSLMERARIATAALLRELHSLADQALAGAFHFVRSRSASRKSRPRKSKHRKPKPRRPRDRSRRRSKKPR